MESLAKLNIYLSNYIWQSEPFNLKVVSRQSTPKHSSDSVLDSWIEGCTHYGDNIEDEWFIIFLLKQLTKIDPNLVVRVQDDDGDFLLIEAADHLPRWLSQYPDAGRNRVFLYNGKIHIIPKRREPLPHGVPSIPDALKVIRSSRYDTKAPREIQDVIDTRLRKYPANIRKMQHMTRVYIPAAVASILTYDPLLITSAVRAFFYRDSIMDSKACRVMKNFPPESRVMRNVVMTRCQYAQLMARDFVPDRKIGWEIPSQTLNPTAYRRYDLGAKIACGFEILVSAAERASRADVESFDRVRKVDLDHDYRWKRFIQCLYLNGYFKDLVKGSREYNDRLKRAKRYFVNHVLDMTSGDGALGESAEDDTIDSETVNFSSNIEMGLRVKKIFKSLEVDYEKLRREEEYLTPEDSDHWMRVTPRDLDAFLRDKFLSSTNSNLGDIRESVPKALSKFVAMESGMDGVDVGVFPSRLGGQQKLVKEKASDLSFGLARPTTGMSTATSATAMKSPSPDVISNGNRSQSPMKVEEGFDADKFVSALKSVLYLKVPSDPEISSSDMSDYSDEDDGSPTSSSLDSDEDMPGGRRDELRFLDNQRNIRSASPSKTATPMKSVKEKASNEKDDHHIEEDDRDMREYMKEMDRQLASTTIGQSFEKKLDRLKTKLPPCPLAKFEDEDEEEEESDLLKEVDVEYNALKNILQSCKEQQGRPGPSSTLLRSMGVFVPSSQVTKLS